MQIYSSKLPTNLVAKRYGVIEFEEASKMMAEYQARQLIFSQLQVLPVIKRA